MAYNQANGYGVSTTSEGGFKPHHTINYSGVITNMNKNEAGQAVTAQLNALADGTPVIFGTTTVTVVKDGLGAVGTGALAHVAGGLWSYLPTQAETDAAHLAFVFTNTLAGTQTPQMYTEINANVLKVSGDTASANNLRDTYNGTGYVNSVAPATQLQAGSGGGGSGSGGGGGGGATVAEVQAIIDGLNNLSAPEVKAEMVVALTGDFTVEPVSVPASNASIADKISYMFAFAANELKQTSSLQTLRNSGDTSNISTASVTTDGVTTTRGEHT